MDYKSIIESKYNRKNWQLLLHDIFGSRANLQQQPFHVETSSSLAKSSLCLGKITLSDEQTIAVYEVELSDSVDIERNRRGIRDMLASSWRGIHAGAFMFCYRNNESVLRFSYVSESWTFAEDGTYKKESTDTKRFTYLLGEGHRSRTAIQQFEKLRDSALSLRDITKAFSVDAVGDMFFKEYKKNYEDIIFYVTGKRMVKVANKWEERQEGDPCETIMKEFAHFPNPEKAVRDYVKKLMGRLVFLQFLQKKGWLGVHANKEWGTGDAEFIQNLFAQTKDKDHFIDNVLEALFNDLNSEDEKLLPQYRTPYLNGGLFERDAQDETNFTLPAKYMQQMLDFFSSYNFTIDENDPDDAEVGVDPEMLGRIFENLLEDNKDKGAFYTPKEIVSYMCRESLIAYLQTDFEDETVKESIRQFVTTHDVTLLGNMTDDIDQRLKDVKICDPAIGSGAFPMGLLKELFQCRSAIEGIDQSTAAEIKKHIIQNNIYGVDIEHGAVDIARLRFWLSLIVDEETPQALPNLDFKIMRGNSLLEQYKGFDLSTIMHSKKEVEGPVQMTFFEDDVDVLRRQVIALRRAYFRETNKKKKKELRQRMREIVQQQINALSYNIDLSGIDIADNAEFFLWHTWFSDVFDNGGFDIVIGNPPYGANIDKDIAVYKKKYKALVKNYADIYKMFIGEGLNISNNKTGHICYITPNTFLSQPRYKDIRSILVDYKMERVVNLGMGVFENAVVPVCISIIKNTITDGVINYMDASKSNNWVLNSFIEVIKTDEIKKQGDLNFLPSASTGALLFNDVFDIRDAGIQYHRSNIGLKNKGGNDLYERLFNENEMYFPNSHPVWYGKLINRYYCSPYTDEFFNLDYKTILKSNEQVSFNKEAFARKDKIIWRQTAPYPIATIDTNYIWFRNTIQCAWIREEYSNKISMLAFLAIINSSYIRFLYNRLVQESGRVFPQVKLTHLKKLPIVLPDEQQGKELGELVNKIMNKKQNDPTADTGYLESKIDRLVYQLYGLTEDEIKIVEGQ